MTEQLIKPSIYRQLLCKLYHKLHPNALYDKFKFGIDPTPEWFIDSILTGVIDATIDINNPKNNFCIITQRGVSIRCNVGDTILWNTCTGHIRVLNNKLKCGSCNCKKRYNVGLT